MPKHHTPTYYLAIMTGLFVLAGPMFFSLLPSSAADAAGALPAAAVDAAQQTEFAVGGAYWAAVEAYVDTTYQALDAAAAAYDWGIQTFVDSTYAARDLSAAAYGGVAGQVVGYIDAVHGVQMAGIRDMGDSMNDGAREVGAAYGALAQWYAQSSARVDGRLHGAR